MCVICHGFSESVIKYKLYSRCMMQFAYLDVDLNLLKMFKLQIAKNRKTTFPTATCSSRSHNSDFTAWFVNSVILSIPILCSILWLILKALSNQIQSDQDRVIILETVEFIN